MNKYKSQGMDLLEAINKANPEANEIVKNRKLKVIQDKLNEGDLEAQSDYITARQGDYVDYDDYARGGIARMLGE